MRMILKTLATNGRALCGDTFCTVDPWELANANIALNFIKWMLEAQRLHLFDISKDMIYDE